MSFDWSNYIKLALQLLNSPELGIEESCYRSSISRAYYGAFCISRDRAGLKNYKTITKNDLGVHKKVINEYKNSLDTKKRQVGVTLDELRRMRNLSDYNGDKTINRSYAERALVIASKLLQDLMNI